MTIFLMLVSVAPLSAASRQIDGPVAAEVVKVIDGDTVLVEAMPWPDHKVSTYVRLRGIDAPELKSKCAAFREAALKAKSELTSLVNGRVTVQLTAISGDKYFGRVVADLTLADGSRPADRLLAAGLAEPYAGKQKAKRVCPRGL
ncbi:MAG: thermonuclease family protein [Allorhizobium sp.]|uniref:Thermonuclease family protein n=1 Tax=Rhizobium rosettiformans TaxID=1368430 RepID=A0ABX7ERN9_9HYPH|nr:thermonuclease family protein [Rhizobium rosettiformans]ODS53998.1 MAG: nuclease [Agrobacterium sp. SCN 61-19]QRF51014.1 thermonuclease family protein [Rhizobium rosettiformans]